MPTEPTRRAWMEVDCRALRANYVTVTQRIPTGCRMLPMVKADAYGIDVTLAVRALGPLGPHGFGVATLDEAARLRVDGWKGRVVVFTPTLPADVPAALSGGFELVVGGTRSLAACTAAAKRVGSALPVHLEVDTGMGRYGFPWENADGWTKAVGEAVESGDVTIASTLTHFHSAETDETATLEQWSRFRVAIDALREARVDPGLVHAANSAAALEYSGVAGDMIRPGIWLYGAVVGDRLPKRVAAVRARVLEVRAVPAGSTVSYGATWTADAPARLATLGIGYADGLRRRLTGRGRALIHGRPAPIRGVVTMDSTVVDVTGRDDVRAGDVATVLGRDGAAEVTPEELAEKCDTISYEILTGWSARIPRIGIDGDA